MAPTTSTTMTLALGDALAVAVMEKRGFQPHDFRTFHPGGKLGAQLLSVSSLMHAGDALPLAPENTPMSEALLVMTAKTFGVVGITGQDGVLTGIITDGDLRRNMAGLMDKTALEVMHKGPRTIRPDALAAEALGVMNAKKITCLFAVDADGKPVGLIHIHDCLRAGVQ
jgi:arabinose-5-phosphate isomerase